MYEKTAVDCCIHASPRPRPASERIELTVTYSDESAEFREIFYGKKGIIHRFMELTLKAELDSRPKLSEEFKHKVLEQAKL